MVNNSSVSGFTNSIEFWGVYDFVFYAIFILTAAVIVFGNVLIIIATSRFKMLRSANNIMVASLALSDLLIGAVYLPMKLAISAKGSFILSKNLCLLNITISFFCVGLAMTSLSMLSIERFYAVQFPFHYHTHMTVTRSLVWSANTLFAILIIVTPIFCGIDSWTEEIDCLSFQILPFYYICAVGFVMFVILLCGFLSFIRVLVAEIHVRRQNRTQNVVTTRHYDSVKCTLMLFVYVFSITCWIPQIISVIVLAVHPEDSNILVTMVVSVIALCSSGVNCFIYGLKNSKFREAFRKMFGMKVSPTTDVSSDSGASAVAQVIRTSNLTLSVVASSSCSLLHCRF